MSFDQSRIVEKLGCSYNSGLDALTPFTCLGQ